MSRLSDSVAKYIEIHRLLDHKATYIVALSGGADSVALLLMMKELGYNVEAAHCNFHLRGQDSDDDEAFCKSLCHKENIHLHIAHFDTQTYASLHHVSIEMAARDLRYGYFGQLRKDIGAEAVCVAHHQEDNAETVLLNLVRGTGLKGLTGMQPRNGNIIRPMLSVTRKDIEDYLAARKQDYRTDKSNFTDDVKRNRIRLDVMPELNKMNPQAGKAISNTATILSEAYKIIEHSLAGYMNRKAGIVCYLTNDGASGNTNELDTGAEIDVKAIRDYISPEYLLYEILSQYGFNPAQSSEVMTQLDSNGKTWISPSHELTVDRGKLIIRKRQPQQDWSIKIIEEGNYRLPNGHMLKAYVDDIDDGFKVGRQPMRATIDADKVKFPLTVRTPHDGDRFTPYGMKGSKLVSDFMTDRKLNVFEKRQQPVVEDASGQIVWLAGLRTANPVAITHKSRRSLTLLYI